MRKSSMMVLKLKYLNYSNEEDRDGRDHRTIDLSETD